jgi:hypothetical protein
MIHTLLRLTLFVFLLSSYLWGALVFLPSHQTEGKAPLSPRVLLWLFSPMMVVASFVMAIAGRNKDSQ